jgi:uncharacterized protein YeeX (DUF496 family)
MRIKKLWMRIKNSKNVVAGSSVNTGGGDFHVGDKTTILNNYYHSAQYQELEAQRGKLQARFEQTQKKSEQYPDDKDFKIELLRIAQERREVEKKLKEFKAEVIRLAETFTKIPLNTERLKLARQHFEVGNYPAAQAILDAEQIGNEVEALLQQKTRLEEQQAENEQHLRDKANEFLILARLTAIDFTQPNRFEKTKDYFEQSLKAAHTFENTFAYAYFLQEHNQFNAALPWYEKILKTARMLAEKSPEAYLPEVAMTLNNLGALQAKQHDFAGAEKSLRETLDTYRRLAKANPEAYLPAVATTLNNLGNLQADQHDFAGAEKAYREALDIRHRLAKVNPEAYLPDVAMTAVNMSIFFLQSQPDKEKSLAYAKEAVQAAQPFMEIIPATKADADKALQVAEAWELEPAVFWKEAIKSLKKY